MIDQRRCHLPRSGALLTALLITLWLSGCATNTGMTAQQRPEAADAYTQLGVAYFERNNLSRALDALSRALEIAPEHAEALQALALVYQRQGEMALAREYFQEALKIAPDFTQARNNFAAFLYAQGNYQAACEQLETASQAASYPQRSQLFTNLGQCYIAKGQVGSARDALLRAQQINPRYARSYYLLAELEFSQGNDFRAWQSMQNYLQLATPGREALQMAIDIAESRGEDAVAADYQRELDQFE